jgi:hypothetical protein
MADYGLQVTNRAGRTLFDSREAGRGTFQYSKGTINPGQSLSTLVSDLVLVNIDRPSGGGQFLLCGTRVVSGTTLTWTFEYQQATISNHPINYVILRDAANATLTGDYGLQCNDPLGAYTGPVTFDSRMFKSTEGEITLNPSEVYGSEFGHGTYVSSTANIGGTLMTGWNGPNGTDYYNAGVCEFTTVTSYVRTFGLLWSSSTTSGQTLYFRQSGPYGNPAYSPIGASYINVTSLAKSTAPSPGAVYSFSEVHSAGFGFENNYYPHALQPMYVGRPDPTLGLYEPTNI